jgi:hypothetical protein
VDSSKCLAHLSPSDLLMAPIRFLSTVVVSGMRSAPASELQQQANHAAEPEPARPRSCVAPSSVACRSHEADEEVLSHTGVWGPEVTLCAAAEDLAVTWVFLTLAIFVCLLQTLLLVAALAAVRWLERSVDLVSAPEGAAAAAVGPAARRETERPSPFHLPLLVGSLADTSRHLGIEVLPVVESRALAVRRFKRR